MQRKLVIPTLVAIFLIGYQAPAELAEKIRDVNNAVKAASSNQEDCTTCSATAAGVQQNDGTLMKACVEKICPIQDFSLSKTYERIIVHSALPDNSFNAEISPLIEAIAKAGANDKTDQANVLLNWLKTAPDLKSPGGIRVFNTFMALNSFSKFKFTAGPSGKPMIDTGKSRAEFSGLSDAEYQRQVAIGNKILGAFLNKAITETDPARIQLVYGSGFKARIEQTIADIQANKRKIETDPDLKFLTGLQSFSDLGSPEKIREQFTSEQINPDAVQGLNQTNSVMKLFVSLSSDPEFKDLLNTGPVNIKDAAAKLNLENVLRERLAKQKDILDGRNSAVAAKCRVAFAIAKEALPSQNDLDRFRQRIDAIKGNFSEKTSSFVCDAASSSYKGKVSSWSANLPLTIEQYTANMKASLKRELEESKKWKGQNEEISRSPDRDIIYSLSAASTKQSDSDATSSADDICDNLMTNLVPDATTYSSNSFVAGPMVVQHRDAEGICYHEMGHRLYYFLKYQSQCTDKSWFAKARVCLLNNHTELTADEVNAQRSLVLTGSESSYESEDWADLVASQVEDKKSNFACLFARQTKDEEYKNLSIRNGDSADPHSSNLFRLLHLQFLKGGSLPEVCEQALSVRGEKANFKNCIAP